MTSAAQQQHVKSNKKTTSLSTTSSSASVSGRVPPSSSPTLYQRLVESSKISNVNAASTHVPWTPSVRCGGGSDGNTSTQAVDIGSRDISNEDLAAAISGSSSNDTSVAPVSTNVHISGAVGATASVEKVTDFSFQAKEEPVFTSVPNKLAGTVVSGASKSFTAFSTLPPPPPSRPLQQQQQQQPVRKPVVLLPMQSPYEALTGAVTVELSNDDDNGNNDMMMTQNDLFGPASLPVASSDSFALLSPDGGCTAAPPSDQATSSAMSN